LDFKPFGAAIIPTPIPRCPKCSFVFEKETFSKKEIKIIKKLLVNNNIFELEPGMPHYYYLARECELLNKNTDVLIDHYLSAIWENSNKANNKDVFKKIANITIKYYDQVDKDDENYHAYKIIELDLLRRLGEFENAIELIETLKKDTNLPENKFRQVLPYQLYLINENDIEEHKTPSEKMKKDLLL
jgi:hypothetical protein